MGGINQIGYQLGDFESHTTKRPWKWACWARAGANTSLDLGFAMCGLVLTAAVMFASETEDDAGK